MGKVEIVEIEGQEPKLVIDGKEYTRSESHNLLNELGNSLTRIKNLESNFIAEFSADGKKATVEIVSAARKTELWKMMQAIGIRTVQK